VAYNPSYPAAHFCLGDTYYKLGRLDEAIASFSEATRLDPAMVEAYNEWGAALTKQGKFTEAEAQFQKALVVNPIMRQPA